MKSTSSETAADQPENLTAGVPLAPVAAEPEQDSYDIPAVSPDAVTTEMPAEDAPQTRSFRNDPVWDRRPDSLLTRLGKAVGGIKLPQAPAKLEMPQGAKDKLAAMREGLDKALSARPSITKFELSQENKDKLAAGRTGLSKMFNAAVKGGLNLAASAAVTNTAKLGAVWMAITAGATLAGAAAIGIVAAGVASAGYTYIRETLRDRQAHLASGGAKKDFKVLSVDRLKKAGVALVCGLGFGSVGALIAQTGMGSILTAAAVGTLGATTAFAASTFESFRAHKALNDGTKFKVLDRGRLLQAGVNLVAGLGLGAVLSGLAVTQDSAPNTAAADPAPSPTPVPTDVVVDVEAPAPAGADAAPVVTADAAPADAPVVESAVVAAGATLVSSDAVAADPLAAGLTSSGLDADASAQALKDAAHNILRNDSIAAADRVAMAQALAQESASQGNAQAAAFLQDLPVAAEMMGVEMPAAATVVADAPIVVTTPDTITIAPSETIVLDAPLQLEPLTQSPIPTIIPLEDAPINVVPVTPADVAPVEELTLTPVAPLAPIDTQLLPSLSTDIRDVPAVSGPFGDAAICRVAASGVTNCEILSDQMAPGSRVAFVSAENPDLRVTTTLGQNSTTIPTRDFISGQSGAQIVADGVGRLQSLVRGVLRLG